MTMLMLWSGVASLDTRPATSHTVQPQQVCLDPPMFGKPASPSSLGAVSGSDQLATEKLGEGVHQGKGTLGSGLGDWLRAVTTASRRLTVCFRLGLAKL
jgi:hypothetical protein